MVIRIEMPGREVHFNAKEKPQREERPCIQCGKPNKHNNAFCSAQCCKDHRDQRRADRLLLKELFS